MSADIDPERRAWKHAVERSLACLTPDRLLGELTTDEQTHVARCARCQAERAMVLAFVEPPAPSEDETVVQAIVADFKPRLEQQGAGTDARVPAPSAPLRTIPPWLLMAAGIVLVIGAGFLWRDVSPTLGPEPDAEAVYRSGAITLVAPVGDIEAPPPQLARSPVPDAERYEVSVFEVDQALLWTASTGESRIMVPAEVQRRAEPAKTLLWEVTARDRLGRTIARSDRAAFRVRVAPRQLP